MTTTVDDPFCHCFKDFKELRLPYKQCEDGSDLTMCILLPNNRDGLWDLVKKVGSDSKFWKTSEALKEGELDLPFCYDAKLDGIATEDLTSNLNRRSNLTDDEKKSEAEQMTGGDQGIEDELHMNEEDQTTWEDQAKVVEVALNEQGTKAAAVTASGGIGMCPAPTSKVDFVADHPFIFMIHMDIIEIDNFDKAFSDVSPPCAIHTKLYLQI
ncbi:hypothetical protein GIB67_004382, partial [Kingdonia uniflora]